LTSARRPAFRISFRKSKACGCRERLSARKSTSRNRGSRVLLHALRRSSTAGGNRAPSALPLHPHSSALRAFPLSLLVEDMPLQLFHWKPAFPAVHAISPCPSG
jgi:hypothetical protein